MSKLDAALTLAASGFKVFPIKADAKHPPLVNNWPALATSDERIVAAQWGPTGLPDANIGIHTDGLIVLDVDPKKGGQVTFASLDDMLGLPHTRTHYTPSGGMHVFYRLPDGHPGVPNSVEELGKGLDVRSTNGYVVAPGSRIGTGEYVNQTADLPIGPAPEWLVKRLGTAVASQRHEIYDQPDAPADSVERAREWLRTAERSEKGQGGDQAAFRVACKLRDLGMSYPQACELMRGEDWDYGCGWRDGRLEEKPIRSAYRYAQNEDGGGRGVVADDLPLPTTVEVSPPKPKKKRSRVIRADQFADEYTSQPYVVKNLLLRESYGVGFGSPGAGKTFVFLDIGYHVANSKPWMGCLVRGGPVLYLAFEGIGGLKKRSKALQQKYGQNLGPLYIVGATMNLREQAGRQELGQILAEMPALPVLVIIDTFARALMGGDENSAQDVGAFNDAIAKLIDYTGACVLLVHHSGKNKAAGARGSSAILGAIDTEIEIDMGLVRPTKQRDVEIIPALPFKLRPTVVGIDDDGDEEKSCVVEQGTAIAISNKPLSPKGEHAFMVLCELTGTENAPVPRARLIAKLQDEGFGRSASHEWVRRLEKAGRATVEDDMIARRLT